MQPIMLKYQIMQIFVLALLITAVVSNDSIRIMPLGDYLTKGSIKVDGAYRAALYESLTNLGYNIDFVGSRKSSTSSTFLDSDHEGHDDWSIADFTLYVEQFIETEDPDIIILTVGSNDAMNDVNEALNSFDELLGKIISLRPSLEIFVTNLTMRKNGNQNNQIDSFNDGLPSLVQNYIDSGGNLNFVDINAVVTSNLMSTNIHPNNAGYNNIGERLAASITFKVMPDGTGLPPRAILKVTGSVNRNEVVVTFSRALPAGKAKVGNFAINGGIEIQSVSLNDDGRKAIIATSKQSHERTYEIVVQSGSVGRNKAEFKAGWRSIILSDWHQGEKYVFSKRPDEIKNDVNVTHFLKNTFGGELLIIPGDTNAGFWSTESFRQLMSEDVGYEVTNEFAVHEAGRRCYKGVLDTFRKGGYWRVLIAVGDHEAGDNPWKANTSKSYLQPDFMGTFGDNINHGIDNEFLYDGQIGEASSRPFGTAFEGTSYAHVHKNTLIVTVNVLYQEDPEKTISDTGTVTGSINGAHLEWFEQILEEGQDHPDVKHIFVQGHFPALFPVRKVQSSGIYMDGHDESDFIEAMRKNDVDIYFAGEVHLNTVTKDEDSNLIQITSRGNYFSNLLTVDISDDEIHITSHREMGEEKTMYNYNYVQSGTLSIEKKNQMKMLDSSGDLGFLDRSMPMLYFNFEEIFSLKDRPVHGLGELPGARRAPIVTTVDIDGVECTSSFPNKGAFGQNYDAQAGNIDSTPGLYGNAALFNVNSRVAILGMGPHSAGRAITYSLWMRTTQAGKRILISYEGFWSKKNIFNLRLRNGQPELCYSSTQLLRSQKTNLHDGQWHHISVVMPFDDCMLSDVLIYIDGSSVPTTLIGEDESLNIPNGGMVSIGGFGHGNVGSDGGSRSGFKGGAQFVGAIDDVFVWARALTAEEVRKLASPPEAFALRSKISYRTNEAVCVGLGLTINELELKQCNDSITQQWVIDSLGLIHSKAFYQKCLSSATGKKNSSVKLFNCNEHDSQSLPWEVNDGMIAFGADSSLYLTLNENNGNSLQLNTLKDPEVQKWDIVYEGNEPSAYLTEFPSSVPSYTPSSEPSFSPSENPTKYPTSNPTAYPSHSPSVTPSLTISNSPSKSPTNRPTTLPSVKPSNSPTIPPTDRPTILPTPGPTKLPSRTPSINPSDKPSVSPSLYPTSTPSSNLSMLPSTQPSVQPTKSQSPSSRPTACEERKDRWGKFPIEEGGPLKSCLQASKVPRLCNYPNVQQKCPIACDLDCDQIGTPYPTSTPSSNLSMLPSTRPSVQPTKSQSPSSRPTACEERKDGWGKFPIEEGGPLKTCLQASKVPRLCNYPNIQQNCPIACGLDCDEIGTPTCQDNDSFFSDSNGGQSSCSDVTSDPDLCTKGWFQDNCPITCFGTCSDCADIKVGFSNPMGATRYCSHVEWNSSICDRSWFSSVCKVSCGLCDNNEGGGGEEEECEDNPDGFMNANGKTKYCSNLVNNPDFCSKKLYQENCKKTCFGTCEETCTDTQGVTINGRYRPCSRADTPEHNLCNKDIFSRACPKSCGLCS